jgi:hypothetical protein
MTAIRDPRSLMVLAMPAALAAAAIGATVVAGGLPGFLIGFTAVLIAVDRLLDFGGSTAAGAEHAFKRISRGRPAPPLAYLADDTGWAATAPRRRLGTETVDIDSIIGTTDRQKAAAFDREFRPPQWSRIRWTQMYLAAQRGTPLPPISVYRVGDRHFLRDGHHRVSVAKATGVVAIEAKVVELLRYQPSERIVSVAHSTAS